MLLRVCVYVSFNQVEIALHIYWNLLLVHGTSLFDQLIQFNVMSRSVSHNVTLALQMVTRWFIRWDKCSMATQASGDTTPPESRQKNPCSYRTPTSLLRTTNVGFHGNLSSSLFFSLLAWMCPGLSPSSDYHLQQLPTTVHASGNHRTVLVLTVTQPPAWALTVRYTSNYVATLVYCCWPGCSPDNIWYSESADASQDIWVYQYRHTCHLYPVLH